MRSIARTPTRVKALYLCRDHIARFLKVHAETEGNMAIIMRQRWASDHLPVVTLDAPNEPAQMIDDGIVSSALRGHVLGNIPSEKAALRATQTQAPHAAGDAENINTTNSSLPTSSRSHARTREWSSSPCPWRTPTCKTNGSATSCACASGCHASRLSRTGSATAADTTGPGTVTGWRGPARATAGTHQAFPSLHGLLCKRRWRRVCYRHNWVRNALAASLNRMPGVQAVLEPMVTTRRRETNGVAPSRVGPPGSCSRYGGGGQQRLLQIVRTRV